MTEMNEPITDPVHGPGHDAEPQKDASRGVSHHPAALSLQALPRRKDEHLVTAIVPRDFQLTLENYALVLIPAGTQALPRHIARHWWARANGVVLYEAPPGAGEATQRTPMPDPGVTREPTHAGDKPGEKSGEKSGEKPGERQHERLPLPGRK